MVATRAAIMIVLPLVVSAIGCSEFAIQDKDDRIVPGVVLEETFTPNPLPRVDILWVLDNTASMADEHEALREQSETFLQALNELDVSWHLGLVLTETGPDSFGVLSGNPWLLTQSMPSAANGFANMFETTPAQSAEGAGLAAALAAINPERLAFENRGFRRPNAALHIIVASDEDDGSERRLLNDPTEVFLSALQSEAEASGHAATLSAIVGPMPNGCVGDTGTALAGSRYIEIAEESGGNIESICSPDLVRLAVNVADEGTTLSQRFSLQAEPAPNSTAVWMDGERTYAGWSIDQTQPALVFASPPSPGTLIRVRYTAVSQ